MDDVDSSIAARSVDRRVCRCCRAALTIDSKTTSLACKEQAAGAPSNSCDCSFESFASPMSPSAALGSREVSFKRRVPTPSTNKECEYSPSKHPRSMMSMSSVGSDTPHSLNSSLDNDSRGAPPYTAPTDARHPDWASKARFRSQASPSLARPSSALSGPLLLVSLQSIVDGPNPARALARADALHRSSFPFVRSGRTFNVHDWTI